MVEMECGGFTFTSNFESGNMARVEQVPLPPKPPPVPGQTANSSDVPDYEFNIWTNPDCAGTEFENSNRSWFYFGMKGGTPFALVKLNLVNLNRQAKMYSQGMAPVYRILPGRGLWDRIRDKPTYSIDDNVFVLSFRHRLLENVRAATTYFAFTFPYSYQDLICSLRSFDKRFKNCTAPEKYLPGHTASGVSADDIYYHRELACHSLDGRRLDLLTITSHHGITPHREPRLKNLFPDLDTPRPYIFVGKKVVFVSARVHPGEVPSSYVLNGLLESLLNREDLTSVLLRRMYVFKIVPMLNPDGVARGHFRTDTRGVNLNRVYLNPSLTLHPTIYAARAIIKYAHFGKEVDDETSLPTDIEVLSTLTTPATTPAVSPRMVPNLEDSEMPHDPAQQLPNLSGSDHSLQSTIMSPLVQTSATIPQLLGINDDKDNFTMQCDAVPPGDEDMINPDEGVRLQESPDSVEMDVEKDRVAKREYDPQFVKEISLTPLNSELNCPVSCNQNEIQDTMQSTSVGEDLENSHDGENRVAPRTGSAPVHIFKKSAKLPDTPNEIINMEDRRPRRETKRKPVICGPPKSMRLFTRPVSRHEDDSRDDCEQHCTSNAGPSCAGQNVVKTSLESSKSGLFLYMDMHGHASKKGIFMYGNHFDDLDQLVECMLLPKIMSINSQNFHFTACNFTERNMYLRDRRDGMSREGCGRVSVMKMTGLVRSYTLECNYNTGRIVNLLPPCIRESGRISVNPAYAVPPKYTPLVFEDVGRALGVSILDITNSNPCSRIPNSEHRSVAGIREWLRNNCLSDSQLWNRMLHRPTRQQVGQSSSSHSLVGSGHGRPVHLTKSVLLARISTELKTLGEEYARREHLKVQRTTSCSQLDSMEGMSGSQPKENIGPGQCGSRTRRLGRTDSSSVQQKPSSSGILQQRPKSVAVAAIAGTSRKKLKGSSTSVVGSLRPVSRSKHMRRSKTQDSTGGDMSGQSGDTNLVPPLPDDSSPLDSTIKSSVSTELCASPKRLKVSNKSRQRKQMSSWVKSTEAEDKSESGTDAVHMPWSANRTLPAQLLTKKAVLLGKLDKNVRAETNKFRPSVLTKVKAVKKLVHHTTNNITDSLQPKMESPQSIIKFMGKAPASKDPKPTQSATVKQSSSSSLDKEWVRSKSSSRTSLLKTGKVDLAVPGPSSGEASGSESKSTNMAGSKSEAKFKANVLRSLEKGSKSRHLCPVRRRSNEGKKAWKGVERKSLSTDSLSNVPSTNSSRADINEAT